MTKRELSAHASEHDSRNDDIKIYINGDLIARKEAMISVYDSGFLLGDGIWEGMRVYNRQVAFFDDHLDRLFESSLAMDMDLKLTKEEYKQAVHDTLAANNMTHDAHIRLMVTRGIKVKPFQDPRYSKTGPSIVIIAEHSKPAMEVLDKGLNLFTVHVNRGLPVTQDPRLNSHSKINCIAALSQAQKAGADEALMLDVNGFVCTCNSTNFFIVRKGEVWTSHGKYCMNGITRQKVIDICKELKIPIYEKDFSLFDVYGADEAFVTGTFAGQTPVYNIDGRSIGKPNDAGDYKPGAILTKIRQAYKKKAGATV